MIDPEGLLKVELFGIGMFFSVVGAILYALNSLTYFNVSALLIIAILFVHELVQHTA